MRRLGIALLVMLMLASYSRQEDEEPSMFLCVLHLGYCVGDLSIVIRDETQQASKDKMKYWIDLTTKECLAVIEGSGNAPQKLASSRGRCADSFRRAVEAVRNLDAENAFRSLTEVKNDCL